MMPCQRRIRLWACGIALGIAACGGSPPDQDDTGPRPQLGLFTSLPIYWGEGDITALIDDDRPPDWVRAALEKPYEILPLDTLESGAINGVDQIVLAQPRPLAPSENLAFDTWVRQGGRALIFADPMLTRHSDFALGDKRRPQDVVLMSPLLNRWGLELRFDESQPAGERLEDLPGGPLPLNLSGTFALTAGAVDSVCQLAASRVMARCSIGEGHVTLIADAALLDWDRQGLVPDDRVELLQRIVSEGLAASDTRERHGKPRE